MEFVFQNEETDNQQINKDIYSVSDGTSQQRGKGGYGVYQEEGRDGWSTKALLKRSHFSQNIKEMKF